MPKLARPARHSSRLFACLALGVWAGVTAPAFAQAGTQEVSLTPLQAGWRLFGVASVDAGPVHDHLDVERLRTLYGRPVSDDSAERHSFAVVVTALRYQSPLNQLRLVNSFYNARPYGSDPVLFGRIDHWATVGEFLRRGGDCEDFAIAKYRTLLSAGFPADRMRIVIVEDRQQQIAHAVLAAQIGNRTYILDNQTVDLLPDTAFDRYVPVYSFNRERVWFHGKPDGRPLASITVTTRTR